MEDFPDVDAYLEASEQWPEEIRALRPLLLAVGLDEEIKWGKPCYTHDDANITIVQEFAERLAEDPELAESFHELHPRPPARLQPPRLRREAVQHPHTPRGQDRPSHPRRQRPARPLNGGRCRARPPGSSRSPRLHAGRGFPGLRAAREPWLCACGPTAGTTHERSCALWPMKARLVGCPTFDTVVGGTGAPDPVERITENNLGVVCWMPVRGQDPGT